MKLNLDLNLFFLAAYSCLYFLQSLPCSQAEVPCSLRKVKPCAQSNETCLQVNKTNFEEGICTCRFDYEYVNNVCVEKNSKPASHEVVADADQYKSEGMSGTLWVLIPCLSLAAMGALVLLGKRYRLTERLYALRVRRYNTVFVSSANVDDDAPIT